MQFLVVPFILLGGLATLSVWLLASRHRFKKHLQNTPNLANDAALSRSVIRVAISSGILGLFLRLYGFDRSLWLDEFGTLWTVEGDLHQVIQRAFSFHGQSPFYYLIVWAFRHFLGVSEIVLRLPSLLFGVATSYVTYMIGKEIGGRKVGIIAASFIWLSPTMVKTNADARPYALALFMTAVMFYGFVRSTSLADQKGRWLFIIGGVGLFTTHYLLSLIALGIALSYLCLPALRTHYLANKFARDVGLQLLLVVWGWPQLAQLWSRRTELSWLGEPNYLTFFEVIGPFIISGLIGVIASQCSPASNSQRAMSWCFCFALATPIACLELLGYFGVNLLERRYMVPLLIPAVVIGTLGLERTPRGLVIISLGYWLLFTAASLGLNFRAYGTFSTAGFQDWRRASECIEKLARRDTHPLLLFRSGFVEEDHRINGETPPSVVLSPLPSVRSSSRAWTLLPLTYSWSKPGGAKFFATSVEPVLRRASVFYFLSCANCFNQATGKYPELLMTWIERQFPGRFATEIIHSGVGITLIRFWDRNQATALASSSQSRQAAASQVYPSSRQANHLCD